MKSTGDMRLVPNLGSRTPLTVRYLFAGLVTLLASISSGAQKPTILLDLTAPPARDQQGLGIPGIGVSGTSGQMTKESNHDMSLQVEIVRAFAENSGDFIVEVKVENTGHAAFEFPISHKLSDVQRKQGAFRREFLFGVRPVSSETIAPSIVGVTAGSHAVPGSLVRLEPKESIRALLRLESSLIRNLFPTGKKELDLHITCSEWLLKDERFAIDSVAKEVVSENVARLSLNGNSPTAIVTGP